MAKVTNINENHQTAQKMCEHIMKAKDDEIYVVMVDKEGNISTCFSYLSALKMIGALECAKQELALDLLEGE